MANRFEAPFLPISMRAVGSYVAVAEVMLNPTFIPNPADSSPSCGFVGAKDTCHVHCVTGPALEGVGIVQERPPSVIPAGSDRRCSLCIRAECYLAGYDLGSHLGLGQLGAARPGRVSKVHGTQLRRMPRSCGSAATSLSAYTARCYGLRDGASVRSPLSRDARPGVRYG